MYLSGALGSLLSNSLIVEGLDGDLVKPLQLFRGDGHLHITWILLPQYLQPAGTVDFKICIESLNGGLIKPLQLLWGDGHFHITWVLLPQHLQPECKVEGRTGSQKCACACTFSTQCATYMYTPHQLFSENVHLHSTAAASATCTLG